jgi:predicted Rossmann fold flavoprotein
LIEFIRSRGVLTKVERGGRVFPESDRAEEVVDALEGYLRAGGVRVVTDAPVEEILTSEGRVTGVLTRNGEGIPAAAVILATGGASYPGTGSTGDGYALAGRLGHIIVPPQPSLVPLETDEEWVREVQGLALKNVRVRAEDAARRTIGEEFGEMLFTHYGVSGPIILTLSRAVGQNLREKKEPVKLHIDLKPALSEEQLDARIQRDFEKYLRKAFKNALDDLLPRSLIPVAVGLSPIDPDKPVHQVTREERLGLVRLLKGLTLIVRNTRSIKEAIVTAGGITTREINPKTMESRVVSGLFMAGELIDVDAYTGGFNLQAAFSTGFVAGSSAAEMVTERSDNEGGSASF